MLKAACSAWWCCRWSSSVAHQSSLSVDALKPLPPPAWIMQPPRLADTAGWDYFTLRRLITMQKQLEGTRSILMSSADRVAHIDGQLVMWTACRAGGIMPSNKTEQSIYECLLGFCFLTTIFCAATVLAASTVFFCPVPETKWWVMVSFGATAAGCFVLNVWWASCNKQNKRKVAGSDPFSWCYSRCFWSSQESYV